VELGIDPGGLLARGGFYWGGAIGGGGGAAAVGWSVAVGGGMVEVGGCGLELVHPMIDYFAVSIT